MQDWREDEEKDTEKGRFSSSDAFAAWSFLLLIAVLVVSVMVSCWDHWQK